MYNKLILLSLFLIGFSSVLPVENVQLGTSVPWFISPGTYSFGKVKLYEYIMMLIILHPSSLSYISIFFKSSHSRVASFRLGCISLIILSFFCFIATLFSSLFFDAIQFNDFLEPLRLILFAFYSICLFCFCDASSARYPIIAYLLGFLLCGIVHLAFAGELSSVRFDSFTGLIGQNGPGPGFAIASLFAALLLRYTSRILLGLIPYFGFVVSAYGSLISFSKNSNLIFFSSIIVFFTLLSNHFHLSFLVRNKFLLISLACVATAVATFNFEVIVGVFENVLKAIILFFNAKFGDFNYLINSDSSAVRSSYFSYTFEAALKSPLGWGAGNFYEAMKAVNFPFLFDEPLDGSGNPHNSWLYYLYIAGFPGLVMTIASMAYFLRSAWFRLKSMPLAAFSVCSAWIIYASALPSIFSAPYFIVFCALIAYQAEEVVEYVKL